MDTTASSVQQMKLESSAKVLFHVTINETVDDLKYLSASSAIKQATRAYWKI